MHATPLVVDDDAIRELLTEVFAHGGYQVETAASRAEVLHLLEQIQPSLTLLDLTMPILDGLGVAQELRQRGSSIPMLILSALDEAGQNTHVPGASWLGKLFDLFVLLATVERCCTGWQHALL